MAEFDSAGDAPVDRNGDAAHSPIRLVLDCNHIASFSLVFIWYFASSVSVIYIKAIFMDHTDDTVGAVIDATVAQLLAGLLGGYFCAWLRPPVETAKEIPNNGWVSEQAVVCAAACDVIGTAATNWAVVASGSSSSQMMKLLESPFTVGLVYLMLGEITSWSRLVAVVVSVVGVAMANPATPPGVAVYWSWFVGIAIMVVMFPLRNVYSKKMSATGAAAYTEICSRGLEILLPLFIGRVFMWPRWSPNIASQPGTFLLMASTNSLYNIISFMVLARVSAVTHAQLRLGKRVFCLVMSEYVFHDMSTSLLSVGGLVLAFGGLFAYIIAKPATKITSAFLSGSAPPVHAESRLTNEQTAKLAKYSTYCLLGFFLLFTHARPSPTGQHLPIATTTAARQTVTSVPDVRPSLEESAFEFVSLGSSFGACGGRITQLNCLETIILADHATAPQAATGDAQSLSTLCHLLLSSTPMKHAPIDTAHIGVCVQHAGSVSAVVSKHGALVSHSTLGGNRLAPVLSQYAQEVVERCALNVARVVHLRSVAINVQPVHTIKQRSTNITMKELSAMNGNFGFWVWAFGAAHLMNPFTTRLVHMSVDSTNVDALIIATANVINPYSASMASVASKLLDSVRLFDVPTIVLGIGVQFDFPDNPALREEAIVNNTRALPKVMPEMLIEFARRGRLPSISVRGVITEQVCNSFGVSSCVPNGCPSLTMNRDRALGQALAGGWKNVSTQLRDKRRLRVVLTMPAVTARAEKRTGEEERLLEILLVDIASVHDCTVIYQTAQDPIIVEQARRRFGGRFPDLRVLWFGDILRWRDTIEKYDMFIGSRIHGTMMGIFAATPSVLISTDFRQWELATAMQIPMVTIKDFTSRIIFDLEEFVAAIGFNAGAFDETRKTAVASYRAMLQDAGLELDPELEHAFPRGNKR